VPVPEARTAIDPLHSARHLHTLGVAESSALRPVAAARLLNSALLELESLGRSDVEAITLQMRVLITLAKVESELRGSEAGMELLGRAASMLALEPKPEVIVALHNQRGVLMLRFGRLHAAIANFDEAEQFFGSATALEQANVLLNRGSAGMMLGQLGTARRDLERCAAIADAGGLPLLQYMSLHNLGYLRFLLGDLPGALQTMNDAAKLGIEIKGVALLDRARVLAEAGLSAEADETLAEASEVLRRDRMAQDLAEAELARAECALVRGQISPARGLAASARTRFRRRGNDSWRRSAELVLLQADLAAGRPGSRLVGPALRLKAEFEDEALPLHARIAGLITAEAYLSAGRPDAAASAIGTVRPPRRRDPITGRMHYAYVFARLQVARDEPVAAARTVRNGLRGLGAYQASFGSIDLQTASAVHGRRLGELGVSIALREGRAAGVFAAAERARATSSRLQPVRPPEDPEVAELLSELRQTVESSRVVMQHAAAMGPLLRRRRELERAITARHWTLAGSGDARPTARLEEVRAAASAADTTVVVYVEAEGELHAVVTGRGRMRLHALGPSGGIVEQVRRVRADLDVLAQPRLPGSLAGAVRSSFDRSTAVLDRSLLAPLGVDGSRLVIVSTGVLGQLPWGTLPSLRGVPVLVAPSATAWLAASEQDGARRRRKVVALAGPDLQRAEHEVAGIKKAWGTAAVHVGAAAGRPALTRAMAAGSVVHVAAHGTHQTENPLFSCLRLIDGPLFAHELDQTARTPEHVILSACELGLATVRPGDEALGLTSVLLHLGTRSVVAGVARVGDELAADTMIAYHERLAAGEDSAAALAEATAKADSPVPFVCFGATWQRGFGARRSRRVP
jgi:tetratricopeptide (TPR) repeat protein